MFIFAGYWLVGEKGEETTIGSVEAEKLFTEKYNIDDLFS